MVTKQLKQLLFILFVSASLPSLAADTAPEKDVSSTDLKTMQTHMNTVCGCMNNMGMMHHDGNMQGGMMDGCMGGMHSNP